MDGTRAIPREPFATAWSCGLGGSSMNRTLRDPATDPGLRGLFPGIDGDVDGRRIAMSCLYCPKIEAGGVAGGLGLVGLLLESPLVGS